MIFISRLPEIENLVPKYYDKSRRNTEPDASQNDDCEEEYTEEDTDEDYENDTGPVVGTNGRLLNRKGRLVSGLKDLRVEFFVSADQKFLMLARGLSSCNHNYFCAWCTTHRKDIAKFDLYFNNEHSLLRTKDIMRQLAKRLPPVNERQAWAKHEVAA